MRKIPATPSNCQLPTVMSSGKAAVGALPTSDVGEATRGSSGAATAKHGYYDCSNRSSTSSSSRGDGAGVGFAAFRRPRHARLSVADKQEGAAGLVLPARLDGATAAAPPAARLLEHRRVVR